jgi:hypothetical protein
MDLDPLSVPAVVAVLSAVLAATASEAGTSLWGSLTSLVRRWFGNDSAPTRIVEGHPDADGVEALAHALTAQAASDPAFAEALRTWSSHVPTRDVTNHIGGDAYVEGDVVQARDVHGSITFGNRERRS